MTTKEFVKRIEELNFKVVQENDSLCVYTLNEDYVLSVQMKLLFDFYTSYIFFRNLNDDVKSKLFDIVVEYTRTPIEEREEMKKYRLKLDVDEKIFEDSCFHYLNYYKPKSYYILNSNCDDEIYQTIFTQEEIDKLPEVTKKCFKQIEVEN